VVNSSRWVEIMLKKYKHISFDLDGTLIHTLPEYRHRVVPLVVRRLGGKVSDSHSVDRFWFEADRDQIIKNEFGLSPKKFWDLFLKNDSPKKRYHHTKPYEDSELSLRKIKELGKIISIITGAPHWIAQMEIQKLNNSPIDFYLSLDEKLPVKPDPQGMLLTLKKLKMKPIETVYIGNSNEDARFAKNAGVDFIYLERKEHQFDLEKESIATIHSLNDLFC